METAEAFLAQIFDEMPGSVSRDASLLDSLSLGDAGCGGGNL